MSPLGAQGPGGADLAAVARDDQLLDLLAEREAVPADDALAVLLAALTEEIDEGLAELLAEKEVVAPAPQPDVRRGRGLRLISAAAVVGATLSVSGVAAAVTGDPFAPYKGLASAISGEDQLPEQAARVAALNRALRGTRAAIAHGDLATAHARLDALNARLSTMSELSHGEQTALRARIAAVEAALARAEAKSSAGKPKNSGRSENPGSPGQAQPTDAGKPDDAGTPGGAGNGNGSANVQPGRNGTGAGIEKSKKPRKPHVSTGRDANGQGSVTESSVAPSDEPTADAGDNGDDGDSGNADDQGDGDGGSGHGPGGKS